jgi:hypothetical protein
MVIFDLQDVLATQETSTMENGKEVTA